MLVRIPLGPRPWLHLLRRRLPGFVRGLRRYYGGVRLLGFVHHRLRLLVFPMRTHDRLWAKPETSRFPRKERRHMPGSPTTPGQTGTRDHAPVRLAFRHNDDVGTRNFQAFAAQWLAYVLPYRRGENSGFPEIVLCNESDRPIPADDAAAGAAERVPGPVCVDLGAAGLIVTPRAYGPRKQKLRWTPSVGQESG